MDPMIVCHTEEIFQVDKALLLSPSSTYGGDDKNVLERNPSALPHEITKSAFMLFMQT